MTSEEHTPGAPPAPAGQIGLLEQDLRRELGRGRVVVVVGAGVSVAATRGEAAASWVGLLENGISRCEQVFLNLPDGWGDGLRTRVGTGQADDLLAVAEEVTRALGGTSGGEYRRWLRETVGLLEPRDPATVDALRDLGVPLVTTNYDSLIERVTGLEPVTWRGGPRIERLLRGDEPGVLHLHGHWEDPASVVLGIRSYEEVLGDAYAQFVPRALSAFNSLLFVGCGEGLKDPNFGALRRWLGEVFAGSEYRHFRLVLGSEARAVAAEHDPGERIFVVPYGDRHEDLAPFLRGLRSAEQPVEELQPPPEELQPPPEERQPPPEERQPPHEERQPPPEERQPPPEERQPPPEPPASPWNKRRLVAVGAGVLAAAVVAVVAYTQLDGGTSDGWSSADVASAEMDGTGVQTLLDVSPVPTTDRAVAVGEDARRPAAWTYDGSWSRDPLERRSGRMNAVAAFGETVIAAGSVVYKRGDKDAKVWRRSGSGPWTPKCPRDACGGNGRQEILAIAVTSAGDFVAVGRDAGTGDFDAAVWLSQDDGETWQRADESDALGGDLDQVMTGVVEAGGRLVAVGWSGPSGAAWTSEDDGNTWELTSVDFEAPVAVRLHAVEKLGRRLIAVGYESEAAGSKLYRAAAWFSDDDGEQWAKATVQNAHLSGQEMVDVVVAPPGVVAVGSDLGTSRATVWQSRDGSDWIGVQSDSFAAPSGMTGIARFLSGTLFAVGSASTDGHVWFSEPGGSPRALRGLELDGLG